MLYDKTKQPINITTVIIMAYVWLAIVMSPKPTVVVIVAAQ